MRRTQFSGLLSNVVACAHSTRPTSFCAITAIIARRTCITRSRAYTRGTEGCGHADNADYNYKEELLHGRHYTAANRRMQGNLLFELAPSNPVEARPLVPEVYSNLNPSEQTTAGR